jgi:hypothetical protein
VFRLLARGFIAIACTACSEAGDLRPLPAPTGPAAIRADIVGRHAREFVSDLRDRGAGSQGELAAATYILGHLQQAGYVVLLDAVPVSDLVRSTNVVARPPSGADPEFVVAVPYDAPSDPGSLGLWLELARALRVVSPRHAVEFVALGAEQRSARGSRRLARQLVDEDADPLIITIGPADTCVAVSGDVPADVDETVDASKIGCERARDEAKEDAFVRAGFEHFTISGPTSGVGHVLIEILATDG